MEVDTVQVDTDMELATAAEGEGDPDAGFLQLTELLEACERDEPVPLREYEWSPYHEWHAMDPLEQAAAEQERVALQHDRERVLDALSGEKPEPEPEPGLKRGKKDELEGEALEDFNRQVEFLKRMAAEARQMEAEESDQQQVPQETNLGDLTPTPERAGGAGAGAGGQLGTGVSLEPLAEMLARQGRPSWWELTAGCSMSLEAQNEGDATEAEAMRDLEALARERQRQQQDANSKQDGAEAEAAGDLQEESEIELFEEGGTATAEECLEIGPVDPVAFVEALSQLYQNHPDTEELGLDCSIDRTDLLDVG